VHDLTKDDVWLVIATDGLWDEINRKQAAEIAKDNDKDQKQIAQKYFDAALDNVSKSRKISREFISQSTPGKKKREIIDDITIVVVNLSKQF